MAYQPGGSIVTDDDGRTKWIEAALAALARGGIEEVRVEVLAKNLGVTKGGFYRRFADRRALLSAILEGWAQGRIAAIAQHAKLDNVSACERLRELIRLYSEAVNPRGMAVELAIRQWSRGRRDGRRGRRAGRRHKARECGDALPCTRLSSRTGGGAGAVALFLYFWSELIAVKQSPRRRKQWIAACSETLTGLPAAKP